MVEDENGTDRVRQVSVQNMDHSVNLLSSYGEDNMEFLLKEALKMLKECKKLDNNKRHEFD